ncbi:MAG: hypothetical protein R3C44_22630 [Chloroflexota bacterium]
MAHLTENPPKPAQTPTRWSLGSLLAQSWAANKPLTVVGIGSAILLVAAVIGILVDPTMVLNEPAWLKPAKFAISITLYSFTFIWLLSFVRGAPRTVKVLSWVTAIMFVVELGAICFQAGRGVRSHFNSATPLDSTLYGIMAFAVIALWVAGFAAAILLIRQKLPGQPALVQSLRLAMVLTVIGAGLGGLMTMPTAEQRSEIAETGQPPAILGAHSVGVPDGEEGLPLLGWNTQGGDLRVGHFIGLHAMQVLPFLGFAIVTWGRRRAESRRQQLGLVWS